MSDARAEALLKSALEKIVYFEARSGQLEGDAATARAEVDRLKAELGAAGGREIALRQQLAELEVALGRAHRDREELGRVVEALRAERTALLEQLLDAASIRGVLSNEDGSFDLAAFISQLRGEVLAARGAPEAPPPAAAAALAEEPADDAVAFQAEVARQMAQGVWGEPSEAPVVVPSSARRLATGRQPEERAVLQLDADGAALAGWAPAAAVRSAPPDASPTTALAERLQAEGRLGSPRLQRRPRAPLDDTLYGFSVRELSAPEVGARIRAAERLGALQERGAAAALAAALHAERDPRAVVADLEALRLLAGKEGAQVVEPFADASQPEVRIAALRALVALDASRAVPQLQRAARDADSSVRRRAALLALQLPREYAAELERQHSTDVDPEVRRVSALAAGASGGQQARGALLAALDDTSPEVRQAAARSLSRLLGVEVEGVAGLEGPPRRREIRRLSGLPVAPLSARASLAEPRLRPERIRVAVLESVGRVGAEALCEPVLQELQSAMRGCTLAELVRLLAAPAEVIESACALLTARGQVVRRGMKLFVA
ncbi:MAG: HEAT repeat domain-containing protein [Myxococcaceae bacterium]